MKVTFYAQKITSFFLALQVLRQGYNFKTLLSKKYEIYYLAEFFLKIYKTLKLSFLL